MIAAIYAGKIIHEGPIAILNQAHVHYQGSHLGISCVQGTINCAIGNHVAAI